MIARTILLAAMVCATWTHARAADTELGCRNGRCPLVPAAPQFGVRPDLAGQLDVPDPAVARAIVRVVNVCRGQRIFGSGTLVDTNEQHGLVLSCAHLFRDGVGDVCIGFTDGRRFGAKVLSVDSAADLAALLIYAPGIAPAPLGAEMPREGEPLCSCGYGPDGTFWCNEGRCIGLATAQSVGDVLELTGCARRGDSGGPVFNDRSQLVGVLFGTNGSVVDSTPCTTIRRFLAPLASRFRRAPAAAPAVVTGPPVVNGPPARQSELAEGLRSVRESVDKLAARLEEQTGRLDQRHRALEGKVGGLLGLGSTVKRLEQQTAQAGAAVSTERLEGIVKRVAIGVGVKQRFDLSSVLFAVVAGALGLSAPPSAVFGLVKGLKWFGLYRAAKAARAKQSAAALNKPPAARASLLKDEYAQQLLEVFQQSGRSPVQDATLGREYDQQVRQAEQSSDSTLARWACSLREKVESKFHRIHGMSPAPAEPVTPDSPER